MERRANVRELDESLAALLGGGTARPLWIPGHVETTFIAATDVDVFPEHEIRCIRVRPRGTIRIPFVDGWPRFGEEGDITDPEVEDRLANPG